MYQLIRTKQESDNPLALSNICSLLEVSRSGYYQWQVRQSMPKLSDLFDMELKDRIQRLVLEFPGYG
jgi:hypothetical protein